jgi:hypothetical protein
MPQDLSKSAPPEESTMSFRQASRVGLASMFILVFGSIAIAREQLTVPEQAVPLAGPVLSLEQLACMSWCELEQLYRQAATGLMPEGYLRGRAIYCPEQPLTSTRSKVTQAIWHGKFFCTDDGMLVNQWCLGMQAVKARLCYGASWLDGGPSILMDYRGTSPIIWRDVRDEIRQVAPGLYLGLMYRCKKGEPRMKMFFALEMTPCSP